MLLRALPFGPTGNQIRFGINYPQSPSASINYSLSVTDTTNVTIYLASGAQRLGGNWDNTSTFTVTNTAGNTWRYSYVAGSSPNFVSGAGVSVGDVVNVNSTSGFELDNTGTYVVTAVTNTYFEVTNYYGTLVTPAITLSGAPAFVFYPLASASNTANLIGTYVNAHLSSYMSISQLQSGVGVVSTSTFDDKLGLSSFVPLVDGENWLSSTNIGTTSVPINQFTLKVPMTLLESSPYTLVGESFYLIPTRAAQIASFLNIFAVTNLNNIANISVSSGGGKIQLYSDLFGSNGAVLVSGGSANAANAVINQSGQSVYDIAIDTISRVGTGVTIFTANRHNLAIGDVIEVAGVADVSFNGVYTISAVTARSIFYTQQYSIGSATRISSVATITTTTPMNLLVGQSVVVAGTSGGSFDGTSPITAIISPYSFQYSQAIADQQLSAGGIVSLADPTITSAVRASNVVTIVTADAGTWVVGETITITGTSNGGDSFNGTFVITSVASPNNFTYSQVGINDSATAFGNVTNYSTAGGTINRDFGEVTIPVSTVAGFQVGEWVKASNQTAQNKSIRFDTTTNITLAGDIMSISSGSGTFQVERLTTQGVSSVFNIETQGNFSCLTYVSGQDPSFDIIQENDWMVLSDTNLDVANRGTFRIIKIFENSLYYINQNTIAQSQITLASLGGMVFYSYDSAMPGDILSINSSVLDASNQGTYTISIVSPASIKVVPAFATGFTAALGSLYNSVNVIEQTPFYTWKKIQNLSIDPANTNAYSVIFNNDNSTTKINVSAGASISARSKFNFVTTTQTGEDSYKYYRGLIHAVGQTIRGEASDTIDFPGWEAAGAYIEIDSALPLRIQLSIVVRNVVGVPFTTIQSRIQTTVESYIDGLEIGQPVVFSEIISLVQQIYGVQAVSVSSPVYNSSGNNDQIILQPQEQAFVLNPLTDILVSLHS
jgi:hypothetical protein